MGFVQKTEGKRLFLRSHTAFLTDTVPHRAVLWVSSKSTECSRREASNSCTENKSKIWERVPTSPAAASPGLASETTVPTRQRESGPRVTSVLIHLVTDGAAWSM